MTPNNPLESDRGRRDRAVCSQWIARSPGGLAVRLAVQEDRIGRIEGAWRMSRPENRAQLMRYLGATQKNEVWSWCAVNHEERKVYFSVWTDTVGMRDGKRRSYVIQEPHWGVDDATGKFKPARVDHDEKLALVFDQGYESFGYFIEAKDKNAHPRQIEETKTGFVFSLELERLENGDILGYLKQRIEIR